MGSIYEARWNYITNQFLKIKKLLDNGNFIVEIEECGITNLVISDDGIYSNVGSSKFVWAENDKDLDHGLHTAVDEWEKWFQDNVKIYHVDIIEWM